MNRTKIRQKLALLGLFCGILCSVVASGGGVSAVDKNSIVSKGALEGLKTCLGSGAFGASWQASNLKKGFIINNGSSDAVKFPYGWSDAKNNNASCKEIMFGGYGGSALIPSNILQSNDAKEIAQFFAGNSLDGSGGVGYTATAIGSETDGQGHQLKLKLVSTKDQCNGNTPAMSLNGTLVSEIVFPVIAKTASGNSITIGSSDYNVPAPGSRGVTEFLTTCSVMPIVVKDVGTTSKPSYLISSESGSGEKTIKTKIDKKQGAIYTNVSSNIKISLGKPKAIFEPNQLAVDVGGGGFANDYKMQWDSNRVNDLYVGFNTKNGAGYSVSGLVDYNSLALSRQETYDLYKYYLKDVFKASIICEGESNYDMYKNETPINWKAGAQCRLYNTGSAAKPKNVYGVNHSYHLNKEITLDDIVITLASLGDLSSLEGSNEGGIIGGPSIPTPTPQPTPNPSEPGATADFDCDSIVKEGDGTTPGKLGAMQWILCPSLNNMAYTANWIDNITQNMLEVKTDRYSTNSGTFKGWEMVRNIANVAMIVFLLVIIFSQITGYGIDNYGIKKMLPRLITMALIINISFYICEVVIDLSNISGVGLRDLFASFGEEISSGVGEDGTGAVTAGLVGIFGAFASSGPAIAAGAAAASLGWVAIVIAAVVLVLIIVVALVTLWLMLGLREIIVVACVVLSPLAFASFILPNTQNLFKKWWDLFKAAIIVYPICGAVAGISYFLRGISGDGDMGMSVAGKIILFILPYLVFFLLPMLLKNALSALGKLGGALSSMGQTIRNGGKAIGQAGVKGVQNSQRYKDWASDRVRRLQQQRADRIMQRYGDGKSLEQRIADAKVRANDTNATSGERRSAQRELQRAEAEQRRFYEAQTTHYDMQSEQALAGTAPEVLATRAESRQEALELKNYSDQFSTFTSGEIMDEINNAAVAYGEDRSDSNRIRLQAAMAEVEKRKMMSRVMNNKDNALTKLDFSTNNSEDMKLLNQFTGSSDITASQFGKQMAKFDGDKNNVHTLNMDNFAAGTNSTVNLKNAIHGKEASLVGATDDSLEYIKNHGRNAATADALLNAAVASNDQKELTHINEMLADPGLDSNTINLSGKQLANLNETTLEALYKRAMTDSVLQQKIATAYNDIKKSPELAATLKDTPSSRKIASIAGLNNDNNSGQGFNHGEGI
ncbi:hypothetical protein J6S55_02070 [Candidatus Saccharibacteria bacterium]|nr:hypothetical protein [Candidatus Saccharibacteria bacterium]